MAPFPVLDLFAMLGTSPIGVWAIFYMSGRIVRWLCIDRHPPTSLY